MASQQELLETAAAVQLGNYAPAPFVLSRGEGRRVWDMEGRGYLDLSGGIAVLSVGHCHPTLAAAIAEQAGRLMHVSNLFYNDRAIELAAAIVERTPFDRVYFANSGAEANESLLKLARRYFHDRGETERVELISARKSFHGRTMGALSLTGQPKYHVGMEPLVGGVSFVDYNDLDAMSEAIGPKTAAVILEPVQAEGGLVVGDADYLRGVRELCDARGALLFFDEVQTGYGRLGSFLGFEQSGVVPDAVSLAKGIAGGFPLGAMAVKDSLKGALPPGSHASTFGGNPLACAAGLAVLEIIEGEGLLENCQLVGAHLGARLEGLVERHEAAVEARGLGLLRGVRLASDVDPIQTYLAVQARGVLITLAGGDVLRICPSLNVTQGEIDEGLDVLDAVLSDPPRKSV